MFETTNQLGNISGLLCDWTFRYSFLLFVEFSAVFQGCKLNVKEFTGSDILERHSFFASSNMDMSSNYDPNVVSYPKNGVRLKIGYPWLAQEFDSSSSCLLFFPNVPFYVPRNMLNIYKNSIFGGTAHCWTLRIQHSSLKTWCRQPNVPSWSGRWSSSTGSLQPKKMGSSGTMILF